MKNVFVLLCVSVLVLPLWGQQGPKAPQGQNRPAGQQGPGQQVPGGPPAPVDLASAGFSEADIKAVNDDKAALDKKARQVDQDDQALHGDLDKLLAADKVDANAVQSTLKKLADLQFQRDWARLQVQIQWKTKYGAAKFDTLLRAFFPPQQGPGGPDGQGGPGASGGPGGNPPMAP